MEGWSKAIFKVWVQHDLHLDEPVCSPTPENGTGVKAGTGIKIMTTCIMGSADIAIFVYTGEEDPSKCRACEAPPTDSTDITGYYFTVPCEVECEEPSPAPTSVPSPTPTCPPDVALIHMEGNTSYPEIPLTVVSQDTDTVTFNVDNTFDFPMDYIYTMFNENPTQDTTCNISNPNKNLTYTAKCTHRSKVAIVTVWMVSNVFDPASNNSTIFDCCYANTTEAQGVVQYTFELDCVPSCPIDGQDGEPLTGQRQGARRLGATAAAKNLKENKVNVLGYGSAIPFEDAGDTNKKPVSFSSLRWMTNDGSN